jgi:hypothetical protein
MPKVARIEVTDKSLRKLDPATLQRLAAEAKAAGVEIIGVPERPVAGLIQDTAGTIAAEPGSEAHAQMEAMVKSMAERRAHENSRILKDVKRSQSPRLRNKHSAVGLAPDVIVGTTGEYRTRQFKKKGKVYEAVTHVARAIDPKILKAQRRSQMRAAQGRWDGKSK